MIDFDMIDDDNAIVCPNCHEEIELEFDCDCDDDDCDADTNINIELNKKGLLSPFFIEVTYERTLYSHTVLQTKMQVL